MKLAGGGGAGVCWECGARRERPPTVNGCNEQERIFILPPLLPRYILYTDNHQRDPPLCKGIKNDKSLHEK